MIPIKSLVEVKSRLVLAHTSLKHQGMLSCLVGPLDVTNVNRAFKQRINRLESLLNQLKSVFRHLAKDSLHEFLIVDDSVAVPVKTVKEVENVSLSNVESEFLDRSCKLLHVEGARLVNIHHVEVILHRNEAQHAF